MFRFRSCVIAFVMAEMKEEKITMADTITQTQKNRSCSSRTHQKQV